jgi:AhpD family alkylhydroperoxidase
MSKRIEYKRAAPDMFKAWLQFDETVWSSSLDPALVDLIYIRVSMVNGCAYCVDSHTRDALKRGQSERRLFGLAAWRETAFFTPRERAALAWADAVTRLTDGDVSDEVFANVRAHFDDKQIMELTSAVVMINAWNRLGISMRLPPAE